MSSPRRLRSTLARDVERLAARGLREIAVAFDALRRIAIALRTPTRPRGVRRDHDYPIG